MMTATSHSVRHWRYQRLSAVLLLPLTLWFILALCALPATDYATVRAWLGNGSVVLLFVLFTPVLFFHAQAGLQVILEDYVVNERRRAVAFALVRLILTLSALLAVLSVMAVYLDI